jgi:hypothetical protein
MPGDPTEIPGIASPIASRRSHKWLGFCPRLPVRPGGHGGCTADPASFPAIRRVVLRPTHCRVPCGTKRAFPDPHSSMAMANRPPWLPLSHIEDERAGQVAIRSICFIRTIPTLEKQMRSPETFRSRLPLFRSRPARTGPNEEVRHRNEWPTTIAADPRRSLGQEECGRSAGKSGPATAIITAAARVSPTNIRP